MNPLHIWLEVCVHLEPTLSSNEVNFQESRYIYLKSGINLLQWSCSLSPGKVKVIKHQKKLQVQTVTRRISVVQSFLFFSLFSFIIFKFSLYLFGFYCVHSSISLRVDFFWAPLYLFIHMVDSVSLSLTFVKVINYNSIKKRKGYVGANTIIMEITQ